MTVTSACVVGGGPAGMMLGLLFARAGIEVTVVEKHADFLRDFRGDTVHPSTLEVLDELGLAERFLELPHHRVTGISLAQPDGSMVRVANFSRLRTKYPFVAMVPQWDFLDLLADEAKRYPTFRLAMETEAFDLIRDGGRVAGVKCRPYKGSGESEIRAGLTIAADGRDSLLRDKAGLRPQEFGAPMDVLWFRVPLKDGDPPEDLTFRVGIGNAVVAINRTTYWQIAYLIRKGAFEELRKAGVEELRRALAQTAPFLADRVDEITSLDDMSLLTVLIDRLRTWHRPGLLCIGDAAHAMSPVGGIGINLAIQDAVAAGNLLVGPLLHAQVGGDPVPSEVLAAVQKRRWFPTVATQGFQRAAHRFAVQPILAGRAQPGRRLVPPLLPKLIGGLVIGRLVGLGVRPEHVQVPARVTPT